MRAATVEDVAQEFMRILSEGWSPDPEEFLHRVPEDLREDCRARLEELLAERDGDRPEEAEQVEETVLNLAGAEDEVIVFELDTEGPIKTIKVPSVDAGDDEPDEPEAEQDEAAELVEAVAVETALQPEETDEAAELEEPEEVADLEEEETAEIAESPVPEPEPQAEIEEAETAEIEEPVAEEEPVVEPEPEPKPEGLVKLTKEEAKAMFEAMERARK